MGVLSFYVYMKNIRIILMILLSHIIYIPLGVCNLRMLHILIFAVHNIISFISPPCILVIRMYIQLDAACNVSYKML